MHDDTYLSAWLPPGTVLTVYNVYAGTIGGFSMKDAVRFIVVQGRAVKIEETA